MRWRGFVAVVAVLGVTAGEASAARFNEGQPQYTVGFSCSSIIFGNPQLVNQTFAYAAQQVPDDGGVPPGGEPFWVKVAFGSVGDICGGGGNALPEFIPPAGVTIVDDPQLRPYWTLWENGAEQRSSEEVVLNAGRFGGTVAAVRGHDSWPYANGGGYINVYLPMRTTRALNGIGTPQPTCPAIQDSSGACPPDQAGDHLQIFVQVADGASPSQLIPFVGLFATEPPAGAPRVGAPAPGGLAVVVPRRLSVSALRRRGLAVTVPAQAAGSDVAVTVRRGSRVVARRKVRSRSATRALKVRLRPPARKGTLSVQARVTPPGGAPRTATARVRIG